MHGSVLAETGRDSVSKSTRDMTGEERAAYLRAACRDLKHKGGVVNRYTWYTGNRVRVSYNPQFNILFCPMCKMGSTFWTRVYKMLEKQGTGGPSKPKSPFDIKIQDAPPSEQFYDHRQKAVLPRHDVSRAFSFLMVRSPYAFLLSAFVDRIVGPNKGLWIILGANAIQYVRGTKSTACGSDVTFNEFVTYVTHELQTRRDIDCHVSRFTACSPCALNYTYVGQMETFGVDSMNILSRLNQTDTINLFKDRFYDLYTDDDIEHSVLDLYRSKPDIAGCIPWPAALRRVWRKLQIRGMLGPTPFPLTDHQAETINQTAFANLLKQASKGANPAERKQMKKEAFNEAYSTISDEIIKRIADVYQDEMSLFGYRTMDIPSIRSGAAANVYKSYFDLSTDLSKR